MPLFQSKTVLVTGGSSGIGLATAQQFVAEGARVYITGRRQPELDAAAAALGDRAVAVRCDAADLGDLDQLFRTITDAGDRLDAIFANAGGGSGLATLEQVSPEAYDDTFGRNVRGTMFTLQKALPLLNDPASIVINGSSSASRGSAGFGVYSASKAALHQFARVWAAELAPRGIRVNTLVPGATDTPGLRGLAPTPDAEEAVLAGLAARNVLGRIGRPEEIARAVLFLASEQSSYMTGSELFIDGGEVHVNP